MDEKRRAAQAKAAMFAAALIWGFSFFVSKNVVGVFPPNLMVALRFTIGFGILCALFRKRLRRIDKSCLIAGAVVGAFLFAAFAVQTIGLQYTTPGKNAFLTTIYCVIVPFLFWAVNKKRPDGYNIAAAFICVAGIGLVSLTGGFSIGLGDSLTIAGGVLYACQIVAIARFAKGKDPALLTIVQFGTAGVLAWIAGLCAETFPAYVPPGAVGGLLFLAVFATTAGLLLQNIGQKYVNASAAAIILSLESVFGVLFSVILYGELLTWRLALGFALIFFAVLLSETKLSFLNGRKAASIAAETPEEPR